MIGRFMNFRTVIPDFKNLKFQNVPYLGFSQFSAVLEQVLDGTRSEIIGLSQ